jgi:CRP/FNR family cyclic AMP-dependent transcriptional regulator
MRHNERRDLVHELKEYPVFTDCTEQNLDALVAEADEFILPPAWSLLQQGIPADALYVVREGTARVYDGRTPVATVGPGDVIGEMAFVAGGQRRATVSSVTRLSGIRVDYDQLTDVLAHHPRVRDAITQVYRSRLRAAAS